MLQRRECGQNKLARILVTRIRSQPWSNIIGLQTNYSEINMQHLIFFKFYFSFSSLKKNEITYFDTLYHKYVNIFLVLLNVPSTIQTTFFKSRVIYVISMKKTGLAKAQCFNSKMLSIEIYIIFKINYFVNFKYNAQLNIGMKRIFVNCSQKLKIVCCVNFLSIEVFLTGN